MKTFFFLLLAVTMYAQNDRPDTLILSGDRTYPCLITGIDDTKIEFIYSTGRQESSILVAIKSISLEKHGVIYTSETGYTVDINYLKKYVHNRNEEIVKVSNVEFADEKPVSVTDEDGVLNISSELYCKKDFKKWSFGVLYIPYYSGKIYKYEYSYNSWQPYPYYPISIYSFADNQTNMEAQITFAPMKQLRFTFDLGYNSSYRENRHESQYRDQFQNSDYGSLNIEGLKLLDFTIGIKYYFIEYFNEQVSVYAIAGLGKQFAFAEKENKDLYPPTPQTIIEDNGAEFLEELNSPWHFNIGFGAEYFFNQSLSLTSNIRFLYSKVSGEYNYRSIRETQTNTSNRKHTSSDFFTRVGLGVNFYF